MCTGTTEGHLGHPRVEFPFRNVPPTPVLGCHVAVDSPVFICSYHVVSRQHNTRRAHESFFGWHRSRYPADQIIKTSVVAAEKGGRRCVVCVCVCVCVCVPLLALKPVWISLPNIFFRAQVQSRPFRSWVYVEHPNRFGGDEVGKHSRTYDVQCRKLA